MHKQLKDLLPTIIKLIDSYGLTLRELGTKINIDFTLLSKVKNGNESKLTYHNINNVVSGLGGETYIGIQEPLKPEIVDVLLNNGQEFYEALFWKFKMLWLQYNQKQTLHIVAEPFLTNFINSYGVISFMDLSTDIGTYEFTTTLPEGTDFELEYNLSEKDIKANDRFMISQYLAK